MTTKYIIIFGKKNQANEVVTKAIENLANKKLSIITIPALVERGEYGEKLAKEIITKMKEVFVDEKIILIDLEKYLNTSIDIKSISDGLKEINDDPETVPKWLEDYLNKRILSPKKITD